VPAILTVLLLHNAGFLQKILRDSGTKHYQEAMAQLNVCHHLAGGLQGDAELPEMHTGCHVQRSLLLQETRKPLNINISTLLEDNCVIQ